MSAKLEVHVTPGVSISVISSGSKESFEIPFYESMNSVFKSFSDHQSTITYSKEDFFSYYIKLNLPYSGIVFFFHPVSQELHRIKFVESGSNCSIFFNQPNPVVINQSLTVRKLTEKLSTISPVYNQEKKRYQVDSHGGVKYIFQASPKSASDVPDENICVKRITLSPLKEKILLSYPGKIYYSSRFICYDFESKAITSPSRFDSSSTPQEFVMVFGKPETVSYKMFEHVPRDQSDDYFYNYFSQGFDVLFDGYSHFAKKIIFHTNFPAELSPSTMRYRKANFEIIMNSSSIKPEERKPESIIPKAIKSIDYSNNTHYSAERISLEVSPTKHIVSLTLGFT